MQSIPKVKKDDVSKFFEDLLSSDEDGDIKRMIPPEKKVEFKQRSCEFQIEEEKKNVRSNDIFDVMEVVKENDNRATKTNKSEETI